jgi:hypothetical protein
VSDSAPSGGPQRLDGTRASLVLAVLGATAALLLAAPSPEPPGPARLLAADSVLGAFDALWVAVVAWPRSRDTRDRVLAAGLVLAVGAPFHAAFAAAAGAATGHAMAIATILAAAALAGSVAGRAPLYAALLVAGMAAVPLAGYGLRDLAGVDALALVSASPLVGPVLLARAAHAVAPVDGAAAAAVLLGVAVAARLAGRRRSGAPPAAWLVLLIAVPASAAPDTPVEPLLGGYVREGRPVAVRAPGARRVRAAGGPWCGPLGVRGDEFLLLGARPRGTALDVEVEWADRPVATHVLALRPLTAGGPWTARLDGAAPAAGECAVRPLDLPTVPEAWLVFDAVTGIPDGLPADELAAITSLRSGPGPVPFAPLLVPPSPDVHRAVAAVAAASPRLPDDVARVLAILAALLIVLVLLRGRRSSRGGRHVVWLATPPLAVCAWLLLGGALPGAIRAHAVVLETAGRPPIALIRLEAVRTGAARIEVTGAAGVAAPVRWSADEAPPAGMSVGRVPQIRLERGRSAVVAVPLPGSPAGADALAPDRVAAAPELLERWLRRAGWRVAVSGVGGDLPELRLEGARLLRIERLTLSRTD